MDVLQTLWDTLRVFRLLWPAIVTLGTVLVGVPLLRRSGVHLTGSRVPLGFLLALIGFAIVAWGVIWAAPDEPNQVGGGSCKATETEWVDNTLQVLLLGSAFFGGMAWATASLDDRASSAKLLGYAALALAIPYVILVSWISVALCGYYD